MFQVSIWLSHSVLQENAIRQGEVRGKGRQKPWDLVQPLTSVDEGQLQPNYGIGVVHFLRGLNFMLHPGKDGDRMARGTTSPLTALFVTYTILSALRCVKAWPASSQLLFQMPYLACTSLNEIRLLLNILFLIPFVPVSSWCLQWKCFLSIWTKRLNQIDSAIEKGTLNLEGLNKLQKCWDFFSPWKLHAWTIPKLLGLPW